MSKREEMILAYMVATGASRIKAEFMISIALGEIEGDDIIVNKEDGE